MRGGSFKEAGTRITVRLTSRRTGDRDAEEWKCGTRSEEDGEEYKRIFSPEQDDWGVIQEDNRKLDLNSPKVNVVSASGQRTSWQVTSTCSACNGM